jgi:hypothetical protein
MKSNWRLLEDELIDIARQHNIALREDNFSNKVVVDHDDNIVINLTFVAQALADRGVRTKGDAVRATL